MKQMRFDLSDGETELYAVETASFPTTRYQGSKRGIIDWLWSRLETVEFDSLLDAFGGTGIVAHRAKRHGKRTIYNDHLAYNYRVGRAIIENGATVLEEPDVKAITTRQPGVEYPSTVQDEFEGVYFTEEENRWLDVARRNISNLDGEYRRDLALAAVGQACLAKRPYNLFHRANLDMRLRDVDRSFGNKGTWDTPFDDHLDEKVEEFNAAVFDNGRDNEAHNRNVLSWDSPPATDLVYLDPPYFDKETGGGVDYRFYYHFLEGYVEYDEWSDRIDRSVQTKRIRWENDSPWTDSERVYDAFETVLDQFADRTIALSYNASGLPTPDEIREMLEERKQTVTIHSRSHQYALSESEAEELLFIATD